MYIAIYKFDKELMIGCFISEESQQHNKSQNMTGKYIYGYLPFELKGKSVAETDKYFAFLQKDYGLNQPAHLPQSVHDKRLNVPKILQLCRDFLYKELYEVMDARLQEFESSVSKTEKASREIQAREVLAFRAKQTEALKSEQALQCDSIYLRMLAKAKDISIEKLMHAIETKMSEKDLKVMEIKSCTSHVKNMIDTLADFEDFYAFDLDTQIASSTALLEKSAEDAALLGFAGTDYEQRAEILTEEIAIEKADSALNKTDAKIKVKDNKIKEQVAAITA